MKDSLGWQQVYVSPRFDAAVIKHIALNAKVAVQVGSDFKNIQFFHNLSERRQNAGRRPGRLSNTFGIDHRHELFAVA
jgi:hypothetical protein